MAEKDDALKEQLGTFRVDWSKCGGNLGLNPVSLCSHLKRRYISPVKLLQKS
jgi:hypothetical protein